MLRIQTNRSLAELSTFGIGGPISFLVEVFTVAEAMEGYAWASSKGVPVMVVGKGSNCLFRDEPFTGLVLWNKIDTCQWMESEVNVGAGYSFSLLGVQTAKKGLSGLEFASGIPATVGGAVFMNAGANGKETFDCLQSVDYLFATGELKEFRKEELFFSYRKSSFQSMQGCILSAHFSLLKNEKARKGQLDIIRYRMRTQPYKEKSAGCIFKNPSAEVSAGALIDRCGLKGLAIGRAKVSEMHANFLINTGGATAKEVVELIAHVQNQVYSQTGIHLEPEIRVFN